MIINKQKLVNETLELYKDFSNFKKTDVILRKIYNQLNPQMSLMDFKNIVRIPLLKHIKLLSGDKPQSKNSMYAHYVDHSIGNSSKGYIHFSKEETSKLRANAPLIQLEKEGKNPSLYFYPANSLYGGVVCGSKVNPDYDEVWYVKDGKVIDKTKIS